MKEALNQNARMPSRPLAGPFYTARVPHTVWAFIILLRREGGSRRLDVCRTVLLCCLVVWILSKWGALQRFKGTCGASGDMLEICSTIAEPLEDAF